MSNTVLKLEKVRRAYGSFEALKGVSLEIEDGEFLAIVGPSGSGKSTLIKLLVGMDEPTNGRIMLHDKVLNGVPADKRPTCMVFQSLALFPHMSVGENIEYPMKIAKVERDVRHQRALDLLKMLHLPENYYDRSVAACSGGERQRVALARALAYDPEILFFDEPLSALDYRLKKNLEKELKRLHETTGKTFVYITHSLEEAMVMADRIAIMRAGEIEQVDTPELIYTQPKNAFVAEFMGDVNLIDFNGDGSGGGSLPEDVAIQRNSRENIFSTQNEPCTVVVRPEVIRFLAPTECADVRFPGRIVESYEFGSRTQYTVACSNGLQILVEKQRGNAPKANEEGGFEFGFDWQDTHIIAGEPQ